MNRDDVVLTFGKEPERRGPKSSPLSRIGDDPRGDSYLSTTNVITDQAWYKNAKAIVGDDMKIQKSSREIRIYCNDQQMAEEVRDMLRDRNISSMSGMEGNGKHYASLSWNSEEQQPKRRNSRHSIRESFSKTAYDANTLLMLQLKIPEEVVKQKEELTQCKEFKDERVKQSPDKKLKDADAMKLADKSVTDNQEVNKGNVSELKSKK